MRKANVLLTFFFLLNVISNTLKKPLGEGGGRDDSLVNSSCQGSANQRKKKVEDEEGRHFSNEKPGFGRLVALYVPTT